MKYNILYIHLLYTYIYYIFIIYLYIHTFIISTVNREALGQKDDVKIAQRIF